MLDTGARLPARHRLLLVLLVCLVLPLVGGGSGDPACFAVPFLPKCFDDEDDEEKPPDNTAPPTTSARVPPPWLREAAALASQHRHAAPETPAPRGAEGLVRDSEVTHNGGAGQAYHQTVQQPLAGEGCVRTVDGTSFCTLSRAVSIQVGRCAGNRRFIDYKLSHLFTNFVKMRR